MSHLARLLVLAPLLTITATPSLAAVFTVINTNDAGTGSLRQSVQNAVAGGAGPHTIEFSSALSGQTIALSSALSITGDITIDATSLGGLTISGDGDRIVRIGGSSPGNVTLRGLKIVDGRAAGGNGGSGNVGGGGGAGLGGAIYVDDNGALQLDSVSFSDNAAQGGDGGNELGIEFDSSGGGYGGGDGGDRYSGGGGGAGLGGAVFVRDGGSVTVIDSGFADTNQASGGSGADGGSAGLGEGGALFLMGGGVLNYAVRDGNSVTLASDVASDGALGLFKTGSGTLVVGGRSRFGSGITISEGTLEGTALSLNGSITVEDTLLFNQDSDGSYSHAISGSGTVVKAGEGKLTLGAVNSYTGGTTIERGILSVSDDSNLGDVTGDLTLSGGTLEVTDNVTTGRSIILADGGEFLIGPGDPGVRFVVNGDVSGTRSLAKAGAGTMVLNANNDYSGGTSIKEGSLEIQKDANLGATGSSLLLDGGNLRIAGNENPNIERDLSIGVNNGTVTVVEASNTAEIAGIVAGSGSLHKRGSGTLDLTGQNNYDGAYVHDGTLVGDANALSGDIAVSASGAAVFDQLANDTYTGAFTGLNGTSGDMVKAGSGTLSLAGASYLDWEVNEGTLAVGKATLEGDITLNNNGTLVVASPAGMTYSPNINLQGAGNLEKTGSAALVLTGNSTGFSGQSDIRGGSLVLSDAAALGGTTLIHNDAHLSGAGTLGTVNLEDGSLLQPGSNIDPVGSLSLTGDLTFKAGSAYEVDVDPTNNRSDTVHVDGQATLAGSVLHVGLDGEYDPDSSHTILTADSGIIGEFDDVGSEFNFLDTELSYSGNSVALELTRNDISFSEIGQSRNQQGTGSAIESLGPGNPLYDAIVTYVGDPQKLQEILAQLSGDSHASSQTAMGQATQLIGSFVRAHSRGRVFGGTQLSRSPRDNQYATLGSTSSRGGTRDQASGTQQALNSRAWGRAFGTWGKNDGDDNAPATNISRAAS
ncbi:autotransporter-associated beta strand repeat-containing protein [Fodinicurvata sediminis]|uniref:autotransporter-associated beta strand repeat-containing protein n=1 Tax=Fodinicurvata sediminis TaxID=1121832 RepID=UPI0003B51734|nr:autotransporter-associated beta strand repeat-containing protein [Fodinicurvata sediminis]